MRALSARGCCQQVVSADGQRLAAVAAAAAAAAVAGAGAVTDVCRPGTAEGSWLRFPAVLPRAAARSTASTHSALSENVAVALGDGGGGRAAKAVRAALDVRPSALY